MKTKTLTLAACIAGLTLALSVKVALGATRGDTTPKATNGAVQILASAATQVFTGMTGRNSYAIFNHGPNTIWCGYQNTVSNTTGFPVGPETSLNVDLVYNGSGDKDFYCRADTADQVSPLDSRWIQVK